MLTVARTKLAAHGAHVALSVAEQPEAGLLRLLVRTGALQSPEHGVHALHALATQHVPPTWHVPPLWQSSSLPHTPPPADGHARLPRTTTSCPDVVHTLASPLASHAATLTAGPTVALQQCDLHVLLMQAPSKEQTAPPASCCRQAPLDTNAPLTHAAAAPVVSHALMAPVSPAEAAQQYPPRQRCNAHSELLVHTAPAAAPGPPPA